MDLSKNCKEQLLDYLCDVPSPWRDQIATVICEGIAFELSCKNFKDCETRTSLSAFTRSGSTISVTYTDEAEQAITRSFDFIELLDNSLNEVDPKCLTDQDTWNALTYIGKFQLLVDSHCTGCTTSTTTTTTLP